MTKKRHNLLVRPRPSKVTLGGKTYEIGPLTLNLWAELENEFDTDLPQIVDKFNSKTGDTLQRIAFIFLRDRYPELDSASQVGNLITSLKEVEALFEVVTELFGGFDRLEEAK